MSVPETTARNRIINILETEFAADGLKVRSDKLNGSLGDTGHVAGVSPNVAASQRNNELVLQQEILVQVFHRYRADIDPEQKVDPSIIEAWADRFRRACKTQSAIADPDCWFFNVSRIEYPDDPTGNKTRFNAYVTVYGNNTAEV